MWINQYYLDTARFRFKNSKIFFQIMPNCIFMKKKIKIKNMKWKILFSKQERWNIEFELDYTQRWFLLQANKSYFYNSFYCSIKNHIPINEFRIKIKHLKHIWTIQSHWKFNFIFTQFLPCNYKNKNRFRSRFERQRCNMNQLSQARNENKWILDS